MTDTRHKPPGTPAPRKSPSMHEDVPVWYDCCSCEAEPYWAELADQPDDPAPGADGESSANRQQPS